MEKRDITMSSLPIIDFGKWSKGTAEERQQVAEQLATACRQVGFVYIINHGVQDEILDEAFGWSKKLFDLPEEKKMLAPHPPGKNRPTTHSQFLLLNSAG
jgi:isopenicillin N synthase-like dioxygenase